MLNFILENELGLVMTVLPLVILANNFLGAAKSSLLPGENFDSRVLFRGLSKGLSVYIGILIYAGVSYLMTDLTITILGGSYTLVDAMYIVLLGTIVKYSTDGIYKLMDIMKYEHVEEDEDINGENNKRIGFK